MAMNTEDFLWYSYFGITKAAAQKNKDDALKKCIDRAFADFQRTVDYKFSGSELKERAKKMNKEKKKKFYDDFNNEKVSFKDEKRTIIFDGIKKEIFGINQNDLELSVMEKFFKKHKKICDKLCDKNSNMSECLKHKITYGQAQKWLNMTLKYMVIMGLWEEELDTVKKFLHVPLDSYILSATFCGKIRTKIMQTSNEKLFDDRDEKHYEEEKYCNYANSDGTIKQKALTDFKFTNGEPAGTLAWSNIETYSDYRNIQEEIKKCIPKGMLPLEWENKVWLAASELTENA